MARLARLSTLLAFHVHPMLMYLNVMDELFGCAVTDAIVEAHVGRLIGALVLIAALLNKAFHWRP